MPSRVQVEGQGDAIARDAAMRGGPLPFLAAALRPNREPQRRLKASERKTKLRKGFMAPKMTGFMQAMAEAFRAQRR